MQLSSHIIALVLQSHIIWLFTSTKLCLHTCLMCVKLRDLVCTWTDACNFGHSYLYLWAHATHERYMSWAHTGFAILYMWCTGIVAMYRQWNASIFQLITFFICCNSILPLMKYICMPLLVNTWKHTVETRVKLYTRIYIKLHCHTCK